MLWDHFHLVSGLTLFQECCRQTDKQKDDSHYKGNCQYFTAISFLSWISLFKLVHKTNNILYFSHLLRYLLVLITDVLVLMRLAFLFWGVNHRKRKLYLGIIKFLTEEYNTVKNRINLPQKLRSKSFSLSWWN